MAELKTKKTDASVEAFLNGLPDENRRRDCYTVLGIMKKATGAEPKMWGTSIVGFGDYRYKYASGREGDWFLVGFSPRKQDLTLYLIGGYERFDEIMHQLGKYKTGKACLYIKKIEDIDQKALEELVVRSVDSLQNPDMQA